jgi:hypothetical protein
MKRIGKDNSKNTISEERRELSGNVNRYAKCKLRHDADGSESPAGFFGMGDFVKSLILCGTEASCIEILTGLPKAAVEKLFADAAAEREEEFRAGARALTEQRQRKMAAHRPGNRQTIAGGLLWQRQQAKSLEASECYADCGPGTQPSERHREDRRNAVSNRFHLHKGS